MRTFAFLLAITACGRAEDAKPPAEAPPTGCTRDAKTCPDGTSVGRTGPQCEFAPCPNASPRPCQMDAKICPDGSSVGRTGPNCEFAPCPAAK